MEPMTRRKRLANMPSGYMELGLDLHDALDRNVPQYQAEQSAGDEIPAVGMPEQNPDVRGAGDTHDEGNGDGQNGQNGSAHAALRRNDPHFPPHRDGLPDGLGQFLEDLGQPAAETAVKRYRRREQADLKQRYAASQVLERLVPSPSQFPLGPTLPHPLRGSLGAF